MENSNSVSYENEMDFIENNDTEENLKNAIYKINYYIYLSIYKFN